MTLAHIQIHTLRHFSSRSFQFHPHINFITGDNGSGKTTILEAIYLLSRGQSFRTRDIAAMVSHGCDSLTVYGQTENQSSISICKSVTKSTVVRLDKSPCYSPSELAYLLPAQVLYQDIFQVIDAGPAIRRSILDWGLFHVKHQYLNLLKQYKRALKQRNTLLKQRASPDKLTPWNKVMSDLAIEFDIYREQYMQQLNDVFQEILAQLTTIPCHITYFKGWDKKREGRSLEQQLAEHYQSDIQRQYTQYGPHHADLIFQSEESKAKQCLSRGQQKIILFALKLAQAKLLDKSCIFLMDDLTAELDRRHTLAMMEYIAQAKGQFFITVHSDINISGIFRSDRAKFIHL